LIIYEKNAIFRDPGIVKSSTRKNIKITFQSDGKDHSRDEKLRERSSDQCLIKGSGRN